MNFRILGIALLGMLCIAACKRSTKKQSALPVGAQAPDFTLLDETGTARSLSEFKGTKVVVYFFPKTDTPGCTKEACSFRDSKALYAQNNITVLGISYDSPATLKTFKEKYHLPFTLLSDSNKEVAHLYGAYGTLTGYFFPQRITILIDEQQRILQVLKDIDVAHHAEDILSLFNGVK